MRSLKNRTNDIHTTGRSGGFIPVGRAIHGVFARETSTRLAFAEAGLNLIGNGCGFVEEPRIAVPRKAA